MCSKTYLFFFKTVVRYVSWHFSDSNMSRILDSLIRRWQSTYDRLHSEDPVSVSCNNKYSSPRRLPSCINAVKGNGSLGYPRYTCPGLLWSYELPNIISSSWDSTSLSLEYYISEVSLCNGNNVSYHSYGRETRRLSVETEGSDKRHVRRNFSKRSHFLWDTETNVLHVLLYNGVPLNWGLSNGPRQRVREGYGTGTKKWERWHSRVTRDSGGWRCDMTWTNEYSERLNWYSKNTLLWDIKKNRSGQVGSQTGSPELFTKDFITYSVVDLSTNSRLPHKICWNIVFDIEVFTIKVYCLNDNIILIYYL